MMRRTSTTKRIRTWLVLWLVVYCLQPASRAELPMTKIYVSPSGDDSAAGTQAEPVQSFTRALDLARGASGAKEIHVAPDELLQLTEPIRLDGRDSGLRVVGHGATLSGGVEVTGWQHGSDGLWRAPCPVEGKVRELFIDGRRAQRARFPNEGWLRIEKSLPDRRSGFTYPQGDLPEFVQPRETLELVFLHDWSISRLPVASIDRATRTLRTAYPIGSSAPHYAIDHFEQHPRYALEGDAALLDVAGEWALQDGEILYRPRDGESPEEITAVVPRLRQLLEIAPGDNGQQPTDIRFEAVSFAYCRWDTPPQGYVSGQATMHDPRDGLERSGRVFIPAASQVSDATDIAFEECKWQHLGGSGLWLGRGSENCVIEDCKFIDVAGNSLNIGAPETENVANRITVRDSVIRDGGAQYYGSVGIWIGMAAACTVEDCEIRNLPYTGVSVGWRWNPTPSPCREHRIANNHIHHVMQILSDGGGIYTLGRQPGTVLSDNHIHDVPLNAGRAQSNGIFMDEGTTEVLVENNRIHTIAMSPIRFHKAGENTIRNNLLVVSPSVDAFTFNNTNSDVIHFEQNTIKQETGSTLEDR